MFTQPTWIEGTLFWGICIIIPLLITLISGAIVFLKDDGRFIIMGGIGILITGLMVVAGAPVAWHFAYEVPSVQQTTITVEEYQPTFGHYWGQIRGADDLMLKTTDGQLFGNTESLLFGKFDTRDVFDHLKPNGTYKITYYGWREGFNNGVPNILSVDEVIDENGTGKHDISNYMNKRSVVYNDDDDWGNP